MLPWTAAVNQALRLGSEYERPLPSRSVGPQWALLSSSRFTFREASA